MENSSENKLRFFYQYSGQKVLKHNDPKFEYFITLDGHFFFYSKPYIENYHLELRSIDSITDDECVEYYNNFCPDLYIDDSLKIYAFKNRLNSILESKLFNCLELQEIDFLRSKAFLVPFMNLTTDQIIEFGWAKIKENE